MAARPGFAQKLEVSWAQNATGLFTFGVSKFGSATDLLAASSWSTTFGGTPYDDLSKRVLSVQINRGRSDSLQDFRAGTITINLRDRDGLLNRENAASPLAGLLLDDRPIRYTLTDANGVPHSRFYGFISDIQADLAGRGTATITAVDFLDQLNSRYPVVTPLAGATTGQIIGKILDWFQWTDPAMRSLAVGDTIIPSYTRADGSRTGLALISELLQAERGIVFANAAGAVTYIDRRTRFMSTSVGSIDRVMLAFPVGTDKQGLINQEAVQRVDMSGNPLGVVQQAFDAASIVKHRTVDGDTLASPLQSPFLLDDPTALLLAEYIVMKSKDGLQAVYQVPINVPDVATQQQCFSRELGDRVTLTIAPHSFPQFTKDFFIEGIIEQVSGSASPPYQCSWILSDVPVLKPFRFGVSQFGSTTDVLYY